VGQREGEALFDDEETLEYIAKTLGDCEGAGDEAEVRSVVLVPEGEKMSSDRVSQLVQALHRDYDGVVLCHKVPPGGGKKLDFNRGPRQKKSHPTQGREAAGNDRPCQRVGGGGEGGGGARGMEVICFRCGQKGGEWRGVVDFRALNEATITDSHPLPRIEDILVGQGETPFQCHGPQGRLSSSTPREKFTTLHMLFDPHWD